MVDDVKKTKSLMKKTKVQLIDIILRKDDVHRKLNDTIDDMRKHFNVMSEEQRMQVEKIKHLEAANKLLKDTNITLNAENKNLEEETSKANKIVEELKDAIDDMSSDIAEKDNLINNYIKTTVTLLLITNIISLFIGFALNGNY